MAMLMLLRWRCWRHAADCRLLSLFSLTLPPLLADAAALRQLLMLMAISRFRAADAEGQMPPLMPLLPCCRRRRTALDYAAAIRRHYGCH